ncbi:MAG: hypothetical protein OXJ52_08590 [Oligoflexia bacterium]|nr:hypothetical protein [Oligoflexia bacterium]
MKYIVLILFLLVACGKTSEESCHRDCNQIKPEIPSGANSQTKQDTKRAFEADPPAYPGSISLEGTTDKGQPCAVTFPKEADSLSHFQVSVRIKQAHKNITVQSLVNVKVVKDMDKPSIYYSKSTPSISLKFQSGNIVYFSVWEKAQKKYSCTFK